jgi:threonine dehydrogenase-like Zn-dependent dehydrogenase
MRQLTCMAPGRIEWCEVPEPELIEPADALVRPITVARCEIDPFLVLAGPQRAPQFALGHEAVAEVVAVGDDVQAVSLGDLVLPAFQVSCGTCAQCRRGKSAICSNYPILSDYGMEPLSGVEYGGMLSDLVRVPHANTMLTSLPAGVDPIAAASVPDNVLDGYRAVAPHLQRRPGSDVVIACHGLASIALYAAQTAVALGAASVTFASTDETALALAETIGAQPVRVDFTTRPSDKWAIAVDCGLEPTGFNWALRATEPEGVLQSVSSYLDDTVPVALRRLYTLGIEFHIGRAHSASLLPEVAALVAEGKLQPELVTTSVIGWEDAPDHYLDPNVKLVVERVDRTS